MTFAHEDPRTWGRLNPLIIAHDVGRAHDRSTAVVGGPSPFAPKLIGVTEFNELPIGSYGTRRASDLADVDARQQQNSLIVADLSNDATYGEVLFKQYGPRLVGLHISRYGDGLHPEWRPVGQGAMLVYKIGRSVLLENLHTLLGMNIVRIVPSDGSKRAFNQLARLERELGPTGTIYHCLPGEHDDLGISLAMLVWAANHPHLSRWANVIQPPRPRAQRPHISALAWT